MSTPKYRRLANALRADIMDGTYYPHQALPTEQALCERFQVSRQTVREALSLLEKEGLIERIQGSGSYIRDNAVPKKQIRRSIAVITTYISDYIFPGILRSIETVLSENEATMLLFATQNEVASERKILKTLLDLDNLDGILVEGTKSVLPNPNLDLYRQLIERKIPLVFFHGHYDDLTDTPAVLDDNVGGGKMLVEYLYNRGHKKIAGIFKSDDLQGHQRFAGYTTALTELGLPLEDHNVLWYTTEQKEYFLRRNYEVLPLNRTLAGCTAVICYNDEIASSIIAYLTQKGINIPEDIAVVSFDNSKYSEMSTPQITSLSHGSTNVGKRAAELLFKIFNDEDCDSELVPWILVQKESS